MRGFIDNFTRLAGFSSQLEGERRARDAEDYAAYARSRAARVEQDYLDRAASGNLGDARLGDLADATAAGLLGGFGSAQTALFLGALRGHMLHLNSDGHNLVYARAGAGKGTTSVQPICADYAGSAFIIDMKDGELHYSSADHRAQNLGHEVVTLDPWNIRGCGNTRICPLHRLAGIVAAGRRIDDEADEIALILLPKGKADSGDGGWVRKGSRRLLAMRMKHLAYTPDATLSLVELWRFVNCSDIEMNAAFDAMIASPREDVSGVAAAMKAVFDQAPKQYEAYRADAIDALSTFSPGGALADATSANEFDFGEMKRRAVTVYLTVPSAKIGVASSWLALILNHAIEQIAAASGANPVRFIIDEFAQLPAPIPAVMKALRLYRGRGILLSMYCQGRFSLRDAGYSEAAIKEIEDQAACVQMWGVEDPQLLKDIELWSGNTSVVQVNPSHSGGQVAHGSFGRSEIKRPVLQIEGIRRIADGRQIIKLPGFPLFVAARVPYWKVTPWKSQLRDVRKLHFGDGR